MRPQSLIKKLSFCLFALIYVAQTVSYADSVKLRNSLDSEVSLDRGISGTVTDEKSEPVPGVSVLISGTTKGVTTDTEGKYKIDIPNENVTLIFSSVGFQRQEVKIGNRSVLNITLLADSKLLEEMVVVGYGTQKKVNLTGSVSSVDGAELTKRTATNTQNLLQGKVSGLQVIQSSGKPGDDNASMRIRGTGTFSSAGSSPLVLVNGVVGDMTNLAPNDIESITVLKDAASASIYGARAANGVILVTTKRGTGKQLSIEVNAFVEAQNPTNLPKLLTNSADYMQFWNEAKIRGGQVPYFQQSDIDAFRNATDRTKYPNFDWIDHSFHTGWAQNYNASVSGGNENTTFNLSLGYLDQGGVAGNYDFKRYNALLSVDSKIRDWISIGGTMQMTKKDIIQSSFNTSDEIMLAIYGSGPNYTPTMTLPDGSTGYVARYSQSIGEWTVRNPESIAASGFYDQDRYNINSQFYTNIRLAKGLTWLTKLAVGLDNNFNKLREHPVNNYYFQDGSFAHNNGVWHLGVSDSLNTNLLTTLYSTLNYSTSIGNHYFSALAGYNQESNFYRVLNGAKQSFPTDNINELAAGGATGQTTYGTANEWAIRSFFARLNYDFKGKYLFEANARVDGSSRIAPQTRWGVFPSVSAGWRTSEEAFLKGSNVVSNLKLRASYGQLGNQNVGLYPYQNILSANPATASYPFTTLNPGVQLNRLVDENLKWETTSIADIGVDLNIKAGLLTLTADWFNKATDNILYQVPVPLSVGLDAPTVNYGKMKNTGFEFEIGHGKRFGDFGYNVTANFTAVKNEVVRVNNPTYGTFTIQEGLPWNSFYLIQMDGIFQNQAEIDAAPKHPFNPKPGDLKFKDANGDGTIDSKDRVVVDGAYAKFYYGGSVNLNWKGFDLSAFFQGVQGQKFYNGGGWGVTPYTQGSAPTLDFIRDRWTGEGSTNSQPAMYFNGYQPVTGTASTFMLYNASYVRLKNVTVGFNFPTAVAHKIGLKDLRLYVSGGNLITITKYPGADPERISNTGRFSAYPQLKTFALGLRVRI